MKPRINYAKAAPGVYEAMDALDQYLARCGLEPALLYLVQLRASQINGCAYCLDMHWKDLRAAGENEQRLYSLPAWRETPTPTASGQRWPGRKRSRGWPTGGCRSATTRMCGRTSARGSCRT